VGQGLEAPSNLQREKKVGADDDEEKTSKEGESVSRRKSIGDFREIAETIPTIWFYGFEASSHHITFRFLFISSLFFLFIHGATTATLSLRGGDEPRLVGRRLSGERRK